MTKKWMGIQPSSCNICGQPLKEFFIDGKLRRGSWAIMCADCHLEFGSGLGLGKGQMYSLDTLKKIETFTEKEIV